MAEVDLLRLLVIFEHREVDDPAEFEAAGVDQAELVGGSAPGVDRIVMLLAGEPNIREVVLFPMNQKAEDLMMNAPAVVDPKQLKELGIKVVGEGAEYYT